jgi:hypothetical protein
VKNFVSFRVIGPLSVYNGKEMLVISPGDLCSSFQFLNELTDLLAKYDVNIMALEATLTSYFYFHTVNSNNMVKARTFEVGTEL